MQNQNIHRHHRLFIVAYTN